MASDFHPGQFSVGSLASRAAARSLIEERRSSAKLVDLVLVMEDASALPTFSPWKQNDNGSVTRRSRIPCGMAFEDAELAAGVSPVQPKGEYIRLWIDI